MQDIQDSSTKPKKQCSQNQIESFEKTMRLRKENIEKRKEEKLLQSAKLLLDKNQVKLDLIKSKSDAFYLDKNEIPKNNIPKTNKTVYQSSSSEKEESINESSSSEEEEVIVVKSKNKKSKPKPKKKTRKTIIFESSSEESSSEEEEEERYVAPPKNKSRVKRSEPEYNLPPPQHHLEPKDFRVYFI